MEDCEKCKLLRQIIAGTNVLLVCYRLGTRKGVDGALDKIDKAERRLSKIESIEGEAKA